MKRRAEGFGAACSRYSVSFGCGLYLRGSILVLGVL